MRSGRCAGSWGAGRMRLDVDEREFEDLEIRLRRSAAGRRPEVPDELLRFIDTVPGSYRRRSRLVIGFWRPRVRAGIAFAATAAALVVAIVAGQALVSVRNGQPGASINPEAPVTGSGWTWQRADGVMQMATQNQGYRVANGYIGACYVDGPDGWQTVLCSSPDGLTWSNPAGPKIVTFDGGDFVPDAVARVGSTYVATSMVSTADVWRSTDGVHWSLIGSPVLASMTLLLGQQGLGVLDAEFAGVASASDGSLWLVSSTDGLTWTRTSAINEPSVPTDVPIFGADRLYAPASAGGYEITRDGSTWAAAQFPDAFSPASIFTLPGGGLVAFGEVSAGTAGTYTLTGMVVSSSDGLLWEVDRSNLPGSPYGLAVSGGRLFATVIPSSPASDQSTEMSAATDAGLTASTGPVDAGPRSFPIWQSADGGQTWRPLQDSTGRQLSGQVAMQDDRVVISTVGSDTSWHMSWVGTPPEPAQSTATVTPPASITTPGSTAAQVGSTTAAEGSNLP